MSSLPFIDADEFSTACTHFADSFLSKHGVEYSVRKSPYDENEKYVVIEAKSRDSKDAGTLLDEDAKAAKAAKAPESLPSPIGYGLVDDEDNEELRIPEPPALSAETGNLKTYTVEYHIAFSPMHRLPVLHFNVYPQGKGGGKLAPITSLDKMYELLVPTQRVEELKGIGVTGAISQGIHPLLGVPFWFVHPCETAEALRPWGSELTLENYLSLWIGFIGSVVGLEFPLPEQHLVDEEKRRNTGRKGKEKSD